MPRVHTAKANKPIYARGVEYKYISKKGKREGQELTGRDKSKPHPDGDTLLVKKGETYYYWEFRYGGKHVSTTYPKPSQLTQSSFLQELYSIQEEIESASFSSIDDFTSSVEDWKERLESLRDDAQESLENIPEHLQESHMLYERVQMMEDIVSEFDSLDYEVEEVEAEAVRQAIRDEGEDPDNEQYFQDKMEEMTMDAIEEKLEEVRNIDLSCE